MDICTGDISKGEEDNQITCQTATQAPAPATFDVVDGASETPNLKVICTGDISKGEEDNQITCQTATQAPAPATYAAVATDDGQPVNLSTCDGGIFLEPNTGGITCTVAGTQDTETEYVAEGIVVTETASNEVTTIARAGTSAGGDFIIELEDNGAVTAPVINIDDDDTRTETTSITKSDGTRIDTEKVTKPDGTVTETETVTAPVIQGIQTITETKTVTKDGVETKSEEKTEKIEDDVDASLINTRLDTLAALPLPQQLKLPLPADGVLLKKSEQSGLVPGLRIEVVTEKKSVDSG